MREIDAEKERERERGSVRVAQITTLQAHEIIKLAMKLTTNKRS